MTKKSTTARDILWPSDENILVRAAFLYVGQGASTVLLVANGKTHDVWVVDINLDRKNGGIDVPRMIADLVEKPHIRAFVNTHPHDDHLNGVTELSDLVTIDEILHSGHVPSKKHGSRYPELKEVIKKVKDKGGKETLLEGSNSAVTIGDARYHVLAPAEYVTDDVNEDDAEARRARIHEQCGVIKFGKGSEWIIITGDADRAAFQKHILFEDYHKKHLPAFALAAAHHGSRSFFKDKEEDDPYLDGLEAIDPECVFVSAPTQEESQHDHPHDDAMELYENHVSEGNVHHMGEERLSFIVDIYRDGGHSDVSDDGGKLAEDYGLEDDEDKNTAEAAKAAGPFVRPKSSTGDLTPRKYG
jgi:beta-lactamase superfamily II metal-dependent hydrolase